MYPPAGDTMASWVEFEHAAPDIASAGCRLLIGSDGVAIGFLATVSPWGMPHLAPVYPIFYGDHLYVSAGIRTTKVQDLRANGLFSLHTFLGKAALWRC